MGNYKEELINIKAFAFDVDGVFSSSTVLLHHSGEMLRTMNIKDGYAVQYAVKKGFPVAIISGGYSSAFESRFRNLGVSDIYCRSTEKIIDFNHFLTKYNLNKKEVLYMGDDIPDIESLKKAGVATCPADAAEEVKAVCDYISPKKGGDGCVRDIIEQVLKVQQKWMDPEKLNW